MRAVTPITHKNKKLIIITFAAAGLGIAALVMGSYFIINQDKKFITTLDNSQHFNVGIVLGAGISNEGKPYDELKARLDTAKEALDKGVVQKLILSGDNRYVNYNEPAAMKQYLENKGVADDKLVLDYAGRSTYESCERAIKIFGVKQTVIFSASSHLPRAIYLCRHFGIDAFGISSGVEANNSTRRELLARVKAVYNTQLIGEHTVLGNPIPLN